jgi:hypothetical protein
MASTAQPSQIAQTSSLCQGEVSVIVTLSSAVAVGSMEFLNVVES